MIPWLTIIGSAIQVESIRHFKTVIAFTPEMFSAPLKLVSVLYIDTFQDWFTVFDVLFGLALALIFIIILTDLLFSNLVMNLQDKWADMFHFLNIINDDVLDLADVTLIQDNYVRLHDLSTEEVCADQVVSFTRKKRHFQPSAK